MKAPIPGLETKSSATAIFLSFVCPGLGQMYVGRVVRAVWMLALTLVCYGLTWFFWEQYLVGSKTEQALLQSSISVERMSEPGFDWKKAFRKAWAETRDLRRSNLLIWVAALSLTCASIVWWTWGMVNARRLCEGHNQQVYRQAAMHIEAHEANGQRS